MDIGQQWRRRMTGFWMIANPMFCYRFRHLQKLHSDAFMGLNAVCLPETNPPGAVYRSSLPATPVSTPIWENHHYFSEQALRDRLCRTPSPRKCRFFLPRGSIPDVGMGLGLNNLGADTACSLIQKRPSDGSDEDSPVTKEALSRESTPENDEDGQTITEEDPTTENEADALKRKIFIGNISYRVTKKDMRTFFSNFGTVIDCIIVHDHIKKRPKGYGFITFKSIEDAQKVFSTPPELLALDGRELRILPAEEKRTTKLKKETKHLLSQNDDLSNISEQERLPSPLATVSVVLGSANNINDLTDDVLLLIFSFLNIKERVKIESVCKRWQILALRTWQCQVSLQHWHCFSVFKQCSLNNNTLRSLLKKTAPNLRKLDLSMASHTLDFQAMEIIAHLCPNLEWVNLTGVQVTNVSLQQLAQKCPKLKVVIIKRSFDVGEKGFWWLLHLCKDLELLDASGSLRLTGQCFHMARPNLRTVILNSCAKICPTGYSKLATKCQNLTSLSLNNCVHLSDRALELLSQSLRKLEFFHVGGEFEELTSAGLHHIGRLSSLEELSVAHNLVVDDHAVCAISRGCRKLRVLNLSGCHQGVTDSALRSISECPRIKTLYISYLDKITDDGVSAVARQGQLEVLQARGCPNLGDKGFVAVALLCPSIRELDVSGCYNVTNLTVQACMEQVCSRPSGTRLVVTIGGTSVSLENLDLEHPNFEVCTLNLCLNHLRPDRVEFFGDVGYIGEEEDVAEEELEEEEMEGAQAEGNDDLASQSINAEWPLTEDMVEDFLTNDDPALVADMWPS